MITISERIVSSLHSLGHKTGKIKILLNVKKQLVYLTIQCKLSDFSNLLCILQLLYILINVFFLSLTWGILSNSWILQELGGSGPHCGCQSLNNPFTLSLWCSIYRLPLHPLLHTYTHTGFHSTPSYTHTHTNCITVCIFKTLLNPNWTLRRWKHPSANIS